MQDGVAPNCGRFRFGTFEVDLANGELHKQGRRVRLQDKPLQVLGLLLEKRGEIATREELRAHLWPADTFVQFDDNLNTAIKRLRETLGDSADSPRFIETVPRRGYRFVAPVESVERVEFGERGAGKAVGRPGLALTALALAGLTLSLLVILAFVLPRLQREGESSETAPGNAVQKMLAVLPFQNRSGEAGWAYVSEGMTDEMIAQLGRLRPERLGVIARSSVTHLENTSDVGQVGRELNVDYLLEGTVRVDSSRLFITAVLVDVASESILWSESYERSRDDIFTVQHDIARRIAESLALELLPGRDKALVRASTTDTAAYEAYFRGEHQLREGTEQSFRDAVRCFEESTKRDSDFAMAYVGLAEAYLSLVDYRFLPESEGYPRARDAVLAAIGRDDTIPRSHVLLAELLSRRDRNDPEIEKAYLRAIELNPSYAEAHRYYALFLRDRGEFDRALAHIRRARRLDPLSPPVNMDEGWILYSAGRDAEAEAQLQKTLEIAPDYPAALYFLGRVYRRKRQLPDAERVLERAVRSSGRTPKYLSALGRVYVDQGKIAEARRLLDELQERSRTSFVEPALIQSLSDELDGAH